MEFQPLRELAVETGGIAFVVGLLFYLVKKVLPPKAKGWLFDKHPWLVNLGVVGASIGVAFLGAWLNLRDFAARANVELVWLGCFSAAVSTWSYEFAKNGIGRVVRYFTGRR